MIATASLIKVMLGVFGTLVTITLLVVKALMKSQENRNRENIAAMKESLLASIGRVEEKHNDCKNHTESSVRDISVRIEKHNDRYSEFLKEFYSENTTQDNKVNACFNHVEFIRSEMSDIRPLMMKKLEDGMRSMMSDLEVYIEKKVKGQGLP